MIKSCLAYIFTVVTFVVVAFLLGTAWFLTNNVYFFERLVRDERYGMRVRDSDEFYSRRDGWDFAVVPLVQPHQLESHDRETFFYPYPGKRGYLSRVKHLDVIDRSVIILHSDPFRTDEGLQPEEWLVIEVEPDTTTSFAAEEDLETYLYEIGIEEYQLESVEDVHARLVRKRHLDWFPDKGWFRFW